MGPTGCVLSSTAARMTEHLLLADAGCSQLEMLLKGALLPAGPCLDGQNFFHAVTAALTRKRAIGDPPRTLHLIAHGRPGAFRIGESGLTPRP